MDRNTMLRTLLMLILASGAWSQAMGQQAEDEGESRTLTTGDGWTIPINYFVSKSGKESPVVIMFPAVEGKKESRTRKAWMPAARALQKKGIAVVVADLRKHGDSVHVSGNPAISEKILPADYAFMATQDLEAIKVFLLAEHEKQKLNIRKLGLATAGSGGLVAAAFASVDWAKNPWPDAAVNALKTPRGQDVHAIFMISPESTVRGINTPAIMKNVADRYKGIAAQIWYNPDERDEKSSAEKLWKYLDLKDEQYESVRSLKGGDPGPAAQYSGEAMLEGRAGPVMEGHIVKFFEDNLKQLEFPWKTRKSRL